MKTIFLKIVYKKRSVLRSFTFRLSAMYVLILSSINLCSETPSLIFAPKRMNFVLGQDGSTPIEIEFKDGSKNILWTYGDTILGKFKGTITTTQTLDFNSLVDIKEMPPNSLAISDVLTDENYIDPDFKFYTKNGKTTQFIEYENEENPFLKRLWANDGIQIGNKLYIYYMDIETNPIKPLDFSVKGTGLVRTSIPETPDISKFKFERVKKFYSSGIIIGDSIIKKGRFLYITLRFSPDNNNIYTSISIARIKPSNIEDFSKYEFLNKNGKWGKEIEFAITKDCVGENSIVYDKYQKEFRITYITTESEIKQIRFKDFKELIKGVKEYIIKDLKKNKKMYYSAKEIFYTQNYIYITYIDPSIYQPIIFKISKK
ncbi:MAG: hypothetical protein K6357_04100 [Elusimicrobiota bacterium]